MNKLYYGNNLDVLRELVATESVDLIYLDPPFNSKRDYNLLFKSPRAAGSGGGEAAYSAAQIEAFEDTWHWTQDVTERDYDEVIRGRASARDAETSTPLREPTCFRRKRIELLEHR